MHNLSYKLDNVSQLVEMDSMCLNLSIYMLCYFRIDATSNPFYFKHKLVTISDIVIVPYGRL